MRDPFPGIKAVAAELASIKASTDWDDDDCRDLDDGAGEVWLDVRLQVTEGGAWSVHQGDAQFDADHSGFWGASSMRRRSNVRELARELIAEAKDAYAQTR